MPDTFPMVAGGSMSDTGGGDTAGGSRALLVTPGSGVGVAPPAALFKTDQELDCSVLGNRVRMPCPGTDKLNVVCELTSATAWGAAVLKIESGPDWASGAAPTGAVDVTSTSGTQKQPGLPITGDAACWVRVSTVAAGVTVRIRMSAMKT